MGTKNTTSRKGTKPGEAGREPEYKIEKGIPLPNRKQGKWLMLSQILQKLDIGDSVFVPNINRATLGTVIAAAGRGSKKQFARRAQDDGFRVWRLADREAQPDNKTVKKQ